MFERLVIVGAGVAGVAAAWAATQRGAQVRLFDGGLGASCLGGGAVDDRPWEQLARSMAVLEAQPVAGALPDPVRDFTDTLGLWRLPAGGQPLARLATVAGRIRLARGHDRALLDLSQLPDGARVLVPRANRAEWHADSLARALNDDVYARSRGLFFEACDAKLLKHVGDDRIGVEDLAASHDDRDRLAWLGRRLVELRARHKPVHGVLVGPWLGALRSVAKELGELVGVPVGEAVLDVGGPAGLRFEAARDRLLDDIDVAVEPVFVERLDARVGELHVVAGDASVTTDSVVLATGGIAAGGIVYAPPEQNAGDDVAKAGGPAFRASVETPDLPIQLAWGQRPLDVVSSIHGPALDEVAWPVDADPSLLEAIGIQCDGLMAAEHVYAAGDAVADMPRTLLQAVFSGIRAGAAAVGDPL